MTTCVGENLVLGPNGRMLADLSESRERSDSDPVFGLVNPAQRGDITNIHELGWLYRPVLHALNQVDSAGFDHRPVFQLRERRFNCCAICECKAIHASNLPEAG